MRIFFDTEFIEDGRAIDLISIGMVAENGDEYYAVAAEDRTIQRAANHPWLVENVVPHLPVTVKRDEFRCIVEDGATRHPIIGWKWDVNHPDWPRVLPPSLIADQVRRFILSFPDPQLWAWYGAYDHVVYAQLFGPMVKLPRGLPMFTCNLKQECMRLGDPRVPEQVAGQHNALEDARHNMEIARFLDERAASHSGMPS